MDEVIVIDAASRDGTAARAAALDAVVLQQDELLSEHGPALGKGDAMWRAVAHSRGDLVCFLDADTEDPHPHHLLGLLGPLLTTRRWRWSRARLTVRFAPEARTCPTRAGA